MIPPSCVILLAVHGFLIVFIDLEVFFVVLAELFHLCRDLTSEHLFELQHLLVSLFGFSEARSFLHHHGDKGARTIHHLQLRQGRLSPLWLRLQLEGVLVETVQVFTLCIAL